MAGILIFVSSIIAKKEELPLQRNKPDVPIAPALSSVKIDQDFGRMPLYFIPNKGQVASQVDYYVQGKDKTIYFTSEGLTYVLNGQGDGEKKAGSWDFRRKSQPVEKAESELQNIRRWVVKLNFMGSNPNVRPLGVEKTEAVISYFKGKQDEWKIGLPTYSRITYRDLWPGIDLVYFGTMDRLKYEFIVHPGAEPSHIRLAYSGVNDLGLNGEGRLEVSTPVGGFEDDVPYGYQEVDGKRIDVALRYKLEELPIEKTGALQEGASKRSYIYGFEVGEYDRTRPLVLDPAVLIYCGYIGGSGSLQDEGNDIAVDSSGNAYISGVTSSNEASFPVTVGPDLTYNGGDMDAFVAKVNSVGTALLYCGYIGGSDYDWGNGIAVDSSGNAYITGYTSSTEATFPVTVGPGLTYNGGLYNGDAFVAKVNSAGTALFYCGYIGGSDDDSGNGIAVDSSGNVYVTGDTESTEATFPVTVGPDLTFNGSTDAFVAKVYSTGATLAYCGYIGGSGSDYGNDIAVDSSGNAYITGETTSTEATLPVTVGPDLTYNGIGDAFVAKVDSMGTSLLYCGYIGGSGSDEGCGIAVDSSGNAYITGYAGSREATFPVTVGPDLTHNGGSWDAFVAKVNSTGAALPYCGYIGGSSNDDYGRDIAVDSSGNAYVTGNTKSTEATFPVTVGPDLTQNGGFDAFVAKVDSAGISLLYCGYIGGSGTDVGFGIAVDSYGNAYITGETTSTEATLPVTVGPDLTYNGGYDAFVAKVGDIYTLTIAAGTGGTTNPVPGSYSHNAGTQVSVTAVPNTGYSFSGWSGSASGTTNPITITMDSDKSVTANFTAIDTSPDDTSSDDGKKGGCFIATAAYGSPLHPHVNILRDFRDKYLMTGKGGRRLVSFYYRYSPVLAEIISKYKVLRLSVRIYLLPAIGFSYLMLHLGIVVTALLFFFVSLFPVFFIQIRRRRMK